MAAPKISRALSCALLASLMVAAFPHVAFAQERAATLDLKRARELDQQGGRAFKDGRFKDAITFFGEAFRYGAPPVELWNIAKCHLKLDEPEAAEDSFRQFLAQADLTAQDRADATRELEELRARTSTLAIDSDPSGATFTIDGAAASRGTTPGSIDIPPGKHHVHVEKEKVGAYDIDVDARLGRALIVQGHLAANAGSVTSNANNAPSESSAFGKPIGIVVSEDFGFFASKLGSYADNVRPVLHLAARYVFRDTRIIGFSAGFRFDATTDGWLEVPVPATAGTFSPACANVPSYSGTELAGFLVGGIQAHVSSRVRLGGDIGIGLADFEGSPAGGQVFSADCNPSYGLRPTFHIGTEASFVLTPSGPVRLRALVEPIVFQAHGAYSGATELGSDLWFRIGSAFGFAVDL